MGLTLPDTTVNRPPIAKQNLVFVCHGTGGLVVRQMLVDKHSRFADKHVALVLMSSPSLGSKIANVFGGLATFYNNELGKQLMWGNEDLKALDDRFVELLRSGAIPQLHGMEACENQFIIRHSLLPNRIVVVEHNSAGRYFGSPRRLGDLDHFSIVKPTGLDHPAHAALVEFWLRTFGPPLEPFLEVS